MKIVIEIEGGSIMGVYSNSVNVYKNTQCVILDHDCQKAGDRHVIPIDIESLPECLEGEAQCA